MTLNVELAEKVLAKIHEHPEMHYQGTWLDSDCGTTACIAGHALLASGEYVRRQDEDGNWNFINKATGDIPSAGSTGARLLGLDEYVAESIFMEMDEHQAIGKLQHLVDEARREQHHNEQPTIQGEKS